MSQKKRTAEEELIIVMHVWVAFYFDNDRKENEGDVLGVFVDKEKGLACLKEYIQTQIMGPFAGELIPYTETDTQIEFWWEHDDDKKPHMIKPSVYVLKRVILN